MFSTRQLFFFLLVCLVASVSCKPKQNKTEKVKVAVYYEVLCPDSIRFITKQLYPAWQTMHEAFKVKLIPYGKAIQNKVNGKWEFECQHGPRECYGNKIQGCALRYKEFNDEKKFDMVYCLMSNVKPDAALQECGTSLNVTVRDIKKCADGQKGDDILAAYGDKTAALNPQLSFVPTVIINEVYNQDDQNMAMRDFKGLICKHATKKPSECT